MYIMDHPSRLTIIFLGISALGVATIVLLRPFSNTSPAGAEDPQAAVEAFASALQAANSSPNLENTLALFTPDTNEADQFAQQALISAFATGSFPRFRLESYEITSPDTSSGGTHLTFSLNESRVYDHPESVTRLLILEKTANKWMISAYMPATAGNAFSGTLSGSVKYSGFYP